MTKKRVRNKEIKFFVTEEELQFIDKKAEAAVLNRSAYIRKIAIEGYIIKQDFSYVEALVYEINKIGTNINQIALQANSLEYLSKHDMISIRNKMDDIYSKIQQFYDKG